MFLWLARFKRVLKCMAIFSCSIKLRNCCGCLTQRKALKSMSMLLDLSTYYHIHHMDVDSCAHYRQPGLLKFSLHSFKHEFVAIMSQLLDINDSRYYSFLLLALVGCFCSHSAQVTVRPRYQSARLLMLYVAFLIQIRAWTDEKNMWNQIIYIPLWRKQDFCLFRLLWGPPVSLPVKANMLGPLVDSCTVLLSSKTEHVQRYLRP